MPPILNYEDSREPCRPRCAHLILAVALIGEIVSVVLYAMMSAGGAMFPFTVAYAPLAILVELLPGGNGPLLLSLFVVGPFLFVFYGYVAFCRRSILAIAMIVCFHLLCLYIVSRLRGLL